MLEVLKDNTEVAYREVSNGLRLSGTFRQIEAAHKLLQYLVKVKGGNAAIRNCHNRAQTQQDEVVSEASNITDSISKHFQDTERMACAVGVQRVEDDICDIDPRIISRSICVTGFPMGTKSENLIIHFQRKKHGGGNIESITINNRGTAVITFDNPDGEIRCILYCFWSTGRYGKINSTDCIIKIIESVKFIFPCLLKQTCFRCPCHRHT